MTDALRSSGGVQVELRHMPEDFLLGFKLPFK